MVLVIFNRFDGGYNEYGFHKTGENFHLICDYSSLAEASAYPKNLWHYFKDGYIIDRLKICKNISDITNTLNSDEINTINSILHFRKENSDIRNMTLDQLKTLLTDESFILHLFNLSQKCSFEHYFDLTELLTDIYTAYSEFYKTTYNELLKYEESNTKQLADNHKLLEISAPNIIKKRRLNFDL